MDMVTSDGRLTPPFQPLTVVNWAAWADAEISTPNVAPKVANKGARA
jgi:hypothetical protein